MFSHSRSCPIHKRPSVLYILFVWCIACCEGEIACSLQPIPLVQNQTNNFYIPCPDSNSKFLERYYDIRCDFWYRSVVATTYVPPQPPWLCTVGSSQILHDIYTTNERLDVGTQPCGGCTSLLGSYILLVATAIWVISALVVVYYQLFSIILWPCNIKTYVVDAVCFFTLVPFMILAITLLEYKPVSRSTPVCHNGSIVKDIMIEPTAFAVISFLFFALVLLWFPYGLSRYDEHFRKTSTPSYGINQNEQTNEQPNDTRINTNTE
jgi:hypothetical protein